MLILFEIYVAYLAAMYQWFLVKQDDISIVLVKVFMSPIPFSTFPFPYVVYEQRLLPKRDTYRSQGRCFPADIQG